MSTPFFKAVTLLALAACSALAHAQTDDAPTRVGRISLAQGQVTVGGEPGEESSPALVNWPITSRNQVTTARDSRTEIRIGSTAIRLDEDSAIDVTELDDDNLRLHLHYGSASVRLLNPEVARNFEISTPQGVVRMQETGRLRIDAGRRADTTVVNVFDGVALLDGGGSRLTVRAGKRAEMGMDDVRTGLAVRDGFDDWALLRDQRDDRSASARYVSNEMTGYEELDQYGTWRNDNEYGPLWAPRAIARGWAPYRDGRWTFVHPWGWTWVDNAPWGYAPSHYGRWLMVNQRWCWAPGRNIGRAVWAPALVGWIGGSGWSLTFGSGGNRHNAPAQGWYPLSPRDHFVPSYRLRHDHLRHLNRHAGSDRRIDHRGRDGLTVVPHDHFKRRGTIVVPSAPRPTISSVNLVNAPVTVPQAPPGFRDRNRDGRPDGRGDRDRDRPATVITLPSQPQPHSPGRRDDDRRARPAPVIQAPAPAIVYQPVAPAPVADIGRPQRDDRPGRGDRDRGEREPRQRPEPVVQQYHPQAPVSRPAAQPVQVQQAPAGRPMPMPQLERTAPPPPREHVQQAPAARPQPAPPAQAAPPAAPRSNEDSREERKRDREDAKDRR